MNEAFIHATADVSPQAIIGKGTRIWNNAQVREEASVGEECIIGKDAYIDKGVAVGNRAKIQNGALLYRPLRVGDGVFIGPQALFANDLTPRAVTPEGALKSDEDWQQLPTTVLEGASIGAQSTVLPGLTIGAWAMVAASSLVSHDVPAHRLVSGVPARPVGWVCRCGARLPDTEDAICSVCGRRYRINDEVCQETGSG